MECRAALGAAMTDECSILTWLGSQRGFLLLLSIKRQQERHFFVSFVLHQRRPLKTNLMLVRQLLVVLCHQCYDFYSHRQLSSLFMSHEQQIRKASVVEARLAYTQPPDLFLARIR